MNPVYGLFAGIGTGVFISLLPGMLNMQVVSTSLRLGRRGGYIFAVGMVLVIALQATLAVLFADFLTGRWQIVPTIKAWAIPILFTLAVGFATKGYFAREARKKEKYPSYKGDPFWRGMIMSAMNLLNIPFIFAIAGFMLAHEWLPDTFGARLLYIPGTAIGSLLTLCCYARMAEWISLRAAFFTRNIYFFVGGMLAGLAVVQAIRTY